jgi:hypothetical protein
MKKKLRLNKETLHRLGSSNLRKALGGTLFEPTHFTVCPFVCSDTGDTHLCTAGTCPPATEGVDCAEQ